jgi:chromosome segregation ATPase
LSLATGAWRKASRGLRHQTASLATADQQIIALSGQFDAFEAERDAMSQQLLSHTQRAKALDTANEKIHELESTIETLEAECVAMTEQIDLNVTREQELQAQVEAGSHTQRAMDQSLAQTEQATRALSEMQARIAGLEQDITAARSDILATRTAKEQLEDDLTQQLGLVKEELASAKTKAGEYEARATADRLAKDTEISSLQATISGLTQSLEAKSSEAETLAKACESLQTTITGLEARVVEASSSTEEVHALQTEKAELQKQLDSVSVKTNALRIEVSSTMSKNQQLKMELAKLTEESQADRVVLAESREAVKVLQGQVDQLEESGHKATGLIKYHEAEVRSG